MSALPQPAATVPSPGTAPPVASERVALGMTLAYGFPNIAGAAMLVPILIHMPKFYADVVLVPLGYLAIAIAVARALDALSDPFVGWLSDRTRSRWGRRRPYMAIGAPLCAVAFCALFSPPASTVDARRGAVVRRHLHPLLRLSHRLRPAALRARAGADARLPRALAPVRRARGLQHSRHDHRLDRARRAGQSTACSARGAFATIGWVNAADRWCSRTGCWWRRCASGRTSRRASRTRSCRACGARCATGRSASCC